MPTISSYFDDGTLSASAALAWKFYAFGMLAIFVTGILGTVIYLGCFKLRKSTTSRADIETNETGASDKAINEPKLMENCDKSMSNPSAISTFPLSPSSATLISAPPKAYTATRGEGCPHEPRGIYVGSQSPSTPAHFSRETLPHWRQ